jgi:hypothetical protein
MIDGACRRSGVRGRLVAAVALSLVAVAGTATPAAAQVRWRNGAGAGADAARAPVGDQMAQIAARARGANPLRRSVITLDQPLDEAAKEALARAGVNLLAYLGDGASFATIDPDRFDAAAAQRAAKVASIVPVEREWKLHPDVAAGIVHPWQVAGAQVNERGDVAVKTIALYAMFHADADLDLEAAPVVTKYGAQIVSFIESINALVIELPLDQVMNLADEDSVQWLEPPLPPMSELNAENRVRVQADQLQAAPYGLTGAGVSVMVYDGGRVFAHGDFAGRLTQGEPTTDSVSDHSTHVAGTIGGSGAGNANHRGMAPGVQIVSYAFEAPSAGQTFLYTDPGDLEADYTAAVNVHGVDITNNSIGNNTEPNGFPCSWQGDYGVTDVLIDRVVRGTPAINGGAPLRVVWAAGNERQGNRCDVEFASPNQDYASSGPPANAKNQISVGALNSNDDSVASFSSWGPADDGRMRPDISAPGCQTGGDGGVTSTSSSGGYNVKCGTSMASPTVAGISALMLQDFRSRWPSRAEMRNSTLKVLLAHTAVDLGNVGPDNQSGYGSVRAKAAIDFMRTDNFLEGSVAGQGAVQVWTVVVAPGEAPLKITMAWDDMPGTPNVMPTLVNDLDLVVTSPSGQQFFPWTLSATQPWLPAVRTVRNGKDNIEQVLVDAPEAGAWTVEVRGFAVPQGPQPYSLSASPTLVSCADQGQLALDASRVTCQDAIELSAVDCGLNTDDNVVESVIVRATSTSDPVGVEVGLTETAAISAAFRGTLMLSSTPTPGALLVASGDTVSVTYNDADTGAGSPAVVVRTAEVDCAGPVISGVAATDVRSFAANIVAQTDEPAVMTLRYGTSCANLSTVRVGTSQQTAHTFALAGLDDNTPYFFTLEATDTAGNTTTLGGPGSCEMFITPVAPDYLTEQFTAAPQFDLSNRSIFFVPTSGPQGYNACSYTITSLPYAGTEGSAISLADDSPALTINMPAGRTFTFFGQAYSTLFLNPNGNITFGSGDSTSSETLTAHFSRPRVAALFDDLNSTQGGTTRLLTLPDRIVVMYNAVRVHNGGPTSVSTFQYELFDDGRIGFHYGTIGSTTNIVGLSRGGGQPPDFAMSNMSSYGSCGPRPPSVGNQTVSTPSGQPVLVTLAATDDGLPEPAALRYIVTALPALGRLTLPDGTPISSAPFEIPGGGNIVRYVPTCSFQGSTSFAFVANDYGDPADGGGDSVIATVNLAVGVSQPVIEFLVDDAIPTGWTIDAGWAIGQPTGGGGSAGGGSGNPDPSGGFTGINVLGYNLSGNYTNNISPMRVLRSPAMDLSNVSNATLKFQRWLGVESSTYDQAAVEGSTDGVTWTTIWRHSGPSLNPTGWSAMSYDIASWADGQPTVYLRWTMGTTDSSVVYCGWNIDDVQIIGLVPVPPCTGDFNDDCAINFSDVTTVLANFGTYNFSDITTVLANFGAQCGGN